MSNCYCGGCSEWAMRYAARCHHCGNRSCWGEPLISFKSAVFDISTLQQYFPLTYCAKWILKKYAFQEAKLFSRKGNLHIVLQIIWKFKKKNEKICMEGEWFPLDDWRSKHNSLWKKYAAVWASTAALQGLEKQLHFATPSFRLPAFINNHKLRYNV